MSETLSLEAPNEQKPPSRFPWFVVLIAGVALCAALYFYISPGTAPRPSSTSAPARLPFGSAEQAYASNLHIENLSLERSENFLQQEVTTLAGEAVNSGSRPLRDAEITIEFFDELHQVVLRETRAILAGSSPLAPGERREFEIAFEHIPTSWNSEHPSVRVTGLLFVSPK
jgi:hypothetical protein